MNGDGISTTGYIYSEGLISATTFKGDGSQLTNLPIGSGAGDKLTSGTLAVTTNSATGFVSLTTSEVTWGYLGSTASYLPRMNTPVISATSISTTFIQISNTTLACTSGNAGTLRFNAPSTTLELCTGSAWVNSAASASGDRISSNTTSIVAQTGGVISITTNGTTANYFDTAGRMVTAGVSVTSMNGVSSTNGYFSQNVGVGALNSGVAGYPLEVSGTVSATGLFVNSNPNINRPDNTSFRSMIFLTAGTPEAYLGISRAAGTGLLSGAGANSLVIRTQNKYMHFTTDSGSNAAMTITSGTGYVGIGTTNPNAKLTVNSSGSDEASISLRNNAGNYYTLWNDNGSSLLNFQYGGVTKMVMNSSGNVGIGTTNPGTALEVSGTISATNISATSLTVNGVAVTGGGGGSSVPSGAVMSFAMSSCPTGWLKANGSAVSRVTYASLFTAIGTTFGTGDGSTTFNVPELRGEFIRGLDDARGIDASRALGSAQSSQNLAHNHGVTDPGHSHTFYTTRAYDNSGNGGAYLGQGQNLNLRGVYSNASTAILNATTGISIQNNGGTEARPRNIALLYCIKQ